MRESRVEAIVFIGAEAAVQPSAWLKSQLGRTGLQAADRRALLLGRAPMGSADEGAIVCVCHQVGSAVIERAIRAGCDTSAAVGRACAAGTNCGSCVPDINRLLAAHAASLKQPAPVPATESDQLAYP